MGATLLAMLLAVLCAPLAAQAPLTFGSRVNLVSVPVVVRDREGHAVGNLRQEDFQVFDKGKPQVITKFSVEKSGSAAVKAEIAAAPVAAPKEQTQPAPVAAKPALPDRYVAYLVDDIHLQGGDLLQARQALYRHLEEALDPSSRAAIFISSGRILADFTDDREKLHQAINSILPWTSGPDPQQDCPPISYYVADYLVNKLLLDGLLPAPKGDPILTAEEFETIACQIGAAGPGLDASIGRAARLVLTAGDRDTGFALEAIEEVVRRLSLMPGSRTIVLASPGFLVTRDGRGAEQNALDRAIRANVTVNTIDMRGLFTTIPGGSASERRYRTSEGMRYLAKADIDAALHANDVLSEVADGTGGTFFHNDNGLKEGLNLLAARPEYVYVLGFSPANLKYDGSYHNLKVTVKNGATLTLQFRHDYWAQPSNPAEEAKKEVREAVFSRDEIQDIPLDIQTEFFKSGEFTSELTVVSRLELKELQFRKADDRNNDSLTVVTGLFNPNGILVAGFQKVVEMHLRDQTMESMRNGGIKVTEDFSVAPGSYVVRVVLRDAEGKTMAARNAEVEIP